MSSKPTDSQDLKLGPGWTSLSKNTSQHLPSTQPNPSSSIPSTSASAAPRIAYTKAELLDLYEPGSTATIPPTMSEYPGLTSSEPLVPVNIAPDDHISHVSALADTTEPPPPRNRFQASATPRPGTEAILGREHPQNQHSSSNAQPSDNATGSTSIAAKKPGHISTSSRDFWSGSAVLAAAERPNATGPPAERRPLSLKPRTAINIDRAASPNGHASDKSSHSTQPYWNRGSPRGAADTNSNWRGGIASGGGKYPGPNQDDHSGTSASMSIATGAQNAPPRKSSSDLMGSSHFGHGGGGRSFVREGSLFGRNNKEALKPTNTRDLSALTKGSTRDPNASSGVSYHDRDHRESSQYNMTDTPSKSHQDLGMENQRIWYYRDPQGNTQGPFTASQLIQWEKEGYYDSELPVSKSRDQGFKPLAIAFGMRKEEPPVAAPPPGFDNANPAKRDATESVSATTMRPTREERSRRDNRTTADLAEEVERMRLEARNQRNAHKQATPEKDGAPEKERSFFDADDSSANNANGHVLDEPLEQKPLDSEALSEPDTGADAEQGDTSKLAGIAVIESDDVTQADPPVKQSRFAAFMRQEVSESEVDRVGQNAGNGLHKESELASGAPQTSHATVASAGFAPLADLARFEEETLHNERSDVQTSGAEPTSAWSSVMMGLQQMQASQHQPPQPPPQQQVAQQHQSSQQQNHGGTTVAPMSSATSEPDLMAIDPAIAHASFAQPSMLGGSPVSSPRASSSEMSPWLSLTGGMDTNNLLGQQDSLLHASQSLQSHSGLQGPLAPHIPSQEQMQLHAHVQRAQAEARARAEAFRQAQVQAQVQAHQRQLHVQSQVHQAQAARAAAQHASALAQVQVQAQTQAQDPLWMYKQRLSQLQAQFDTHYRAHVELTRASRAAQAAISSSPAGSHDNQRARTVLAQATSALKEHALQMERIRVAANTTHAHMVQHQAAAAREQQLQAQAHAAMPSPESHGNASPHSIGNSQTHSPAQRVANGSSQAAVPSAVPLADSPKPPLDDLSPNVLEFEEDTQLSPKRNLDKSYDPTAPDEGWEKVGRKTREAAEEARDVEVEPGLRQISPDAAYERDANMESPVGSGMNRPSPNGAMKMESEQPVMQENEHDVNALPELATTARSAHESAPVVAPWSKSTSTNVASNGLSLREIQRQEELRNQAEEREAAAQQEKEEAMKATSTRWSHNGQPWGGAGGPTKQQTLSLREIEEEQKKKKAAVVARESVTTTSSQGPGRPVGMKTGWASIAAKNSNLPTRRPSAATVVGKKMEDEASFWDSVSVQNQTTVNNPSGSTRPSFTRPAQTVAPQPTHNATAARTAVTKPAAPPTPTTRRVQGGSKASKVDGREGAAAEESVAIGGRISHEFANWFAENMQKLTGDKSGDTMLCEYLVTIPSQSEIKDTILQNLGANDMTRSFADEFVRRLEFERTSVVADASAGGPGGRKKGRRHRAAKVDPSLVLGFTSTSSRIMQGTIETPEMK